MPAKPLVTPEMLIFSSEVRIISTAGHRTTPKMSNNAGPIHGSGPR